jgi:phosphatidylinositol alpha-1,6-mannosyltransferase
MERLNLRLFQGLLGADPGSALVGPRGCEASLPPGTLVRGLPAWSRIRFVLSSRLGAVGLARRIRPRVVLAGSGLAAPAALLAARQTGALPAVFLHGLDIIAPSRLYRLAWWPCIRRCDCVLVNSRNTRELALGMGVRPERIHVVHPGTDLPAPDGAAKARFRGRFGIPPDVPMLLSVGRLTARKGLARFVSDCLPAIARRHPAVRLAIIGDQAEDALHRGQGAGIAPVLAAASRHGLADAIVWLGPQDEAVLSDAYQAADVHVFPVRAIPGDVEGFGMVAIEAAARGLPTVGFDVGGVADALEDGRNGRLVPADDFDAFARAVLDLLSDPDTARRSADALAFAQRYSWQRFHDEVAAALGKALAGGAGQHAG